MPDRVFELIGSCSGMLMVLAVNLRRDTRVGAALAHVLIADATKCRHEGDAAYVAWQLYAMRISSFTKCNRIRRGRSMASSK